MPKPVSAATLDETPHERKFKLRGVPYHFVELDIMAYDDLTRQAMEQGPDGETINNKLHSQLLLVATCASPKLTLERVRKMPFSLANNLVGLMNEMYYSVEVPLTVDDDEEADEAQGEG